MIRKAFNAVRRHWQEVSVAIAPFVLLMPLLNLTSHWISISLPWFKADSMKWLVQILGQSCPSLVFALPNFAVSIAAGLTFGIANKQRALRLAWIFGIGMFVAQNVPSFLTNRPEWYLRLFNLAHIALPVATAAAWLRLIQVKQPGHCQQCDYNLTGNESGVCPECGRNID